MSDLIQVGPRSKQVLKALYENGPLSNATLREIIDPKMCVRSMNYAIKRLSDLGFVNNKHSSIKKSAGRFVQLTNNTDLKPFLADVLNVATESLKYVHGGTEALEHSQDCAIWSKYLKCQFPDGKVIRDFHISRDQSAMETLLVDPTDIDLLPDMILRFPNIGQKGSVNVGIEVERTQKSEVRIMKKLRKFASRTRLDSVLYICKKPQIVKKVASVYEKLVVPKALRIQHYADNFLHITGMARPENELPLPVSTTGGKTFSLTSWIHFLRTHQMSERRHFCASTHSTPGI